MPQPRGLSGARRVTSGQPRVVRARADRARGASSGPGGVRLAHARGVHRGQARRIDRATTDLEHRYTASTFADTVEVVRLGTTEAWRPGGDGQRALAGRTSSPWGEATAAGWSPRLGNPFNGRRTMSEPTTSAPPIVLIHGLWMTARS